MSDLQSDESLFLVSWPRAVRRRPADELWRVEAVRNGRGEFLTVCVPASLRLDGRDVPAILAEAVSLTLTVEGQVECSYGGKVAVEVVRVEFLGVVGAREILVQELVAVRAPRRAANRHSVACDGGAN